MNDVAQPRPLAIRAAFLMMALVVLVVSGQYWLRIVQGEAEQPPWQQIAAPILLSASLVLQFFAKTRGSKLRLASLGVGVLALLMLV